MNMTIVRRRISLFLCFVLIISLFAQWSPIVYAANNAWPELTNFEVTGNKIYDSGNPANATFACDITGDIEIQNYGEIRVIKGSNVVGEIHITVNNPRVVENGVVTDTPADYPNSLYIPRGYGGEITKPDAEFFEMPIKLNKVEGENQYKNAADGIEIDFDDEEYYYDVIVTYEAEVPPIPQASYSITSNIEGNYWLNGGTDPNYIFPAGSIVVSVDGNAVIEKVQPGKQVLVNATPEQYIDIDTVVYDSKFDHWEVTGFTLAESDKTNESFTFEMPENDVTITAFFVKKGSKITLSSRDYSAGEVYMQIGWFLDSTNMTYIIGGEHVRDSVTDIIAAGAEVMFDVDNLNPNYKPVTWVITNVTTNESVTPVRTEEITRNGITYERPYIVVDGVSEYVVQAVFEAKDYGNVSVTVNSEEMGTATAKVGTGNASATLENVIEGTEVTLNAVPNTGYLFVSWAASCNGAVVEITDADKADASFIMPATPGDSKVEVVATFKADPAYASHDCGIEEAELTDLNSNVYAADQDGIAFTITLPAGTDASSLAQWPLTLEISEGATVAKKGDASWTNGAACGMALNTPVTFTVTAEDGQTTQDYTIKIMMEGYIPISFSHNCEFANNIALHYAIAESSLEGYEDIKLVIQMEKYGEDAAEPSLRDYTVTKYTIDTINGKKMYHFVFPGIFAAEMGNKVYAKIVAVKDGSEYASAVDEYSIKQFAYNRLVKSTQESYKKMLVDMLNYGAAAQIHFKLNASAPVNEDLTAEQRALGTQTDPVLENKESKVVNSAATAVIDGKNLVYDSNVELAYRMAFAEGQDMSNVKIVFSYNDFKGNPKSQIVKADRFTATGSKYIAYCTIIAPTDMGCVVSATIYDGDTAISDTVNYSIETYVYNRLLNSSSETYKALITDMMKYAFSTRDHFSK